jgi:CRISPR-associated protein Csb2
MVMPSYLCVSVTFLAPYFHGRRDGGEPEWPPSPLRLFQALVAASAHDGLDHMRPALRWLERQAPPLIVAPPGERTGGYRLSVPNNAMDIVARAWARGNDSGQGDANPATHRTMKTVRPMRLQDGDGFATVHYLWNLPDPLPDGIRAHVENLSSAARNIVALGWGVDLVVGHGQVLPQEDADCLPGECWRPSANQATGRLRVPAEDTLAGLEQRHARFLNRLSGNGFRPVPALATFDLVAYRRATDPSARPLAAFSILNLDASGFRPYNPVRHTAVVAGMVRHALAQAADTAGWSQERINQVIHGHTPDGNGPARSGPDNPRLAYVPLPSIESRGAKDGERTSHVGSIRRVLVVGHPGMDAEIAWARRILSGQELIDERTGQSVALLSLLPNSDATVRGYVAPSSIWSTVTPLILPGYDDPDHVRRRLGELRDAQDAAQKKPELLGRLDDRIDKLLRKALGHAGFTDSLAVHAELEWRRVGFRAGLDRADRYAVPEKLRRYSRCHVRIRWRNAAGQTAAMPGPLVIGGGRFCGLGLFVRECEG